MRRETAKIYTPWLLIVEASVQNLKNVELVVHLLSRHFRFIQHFSYIITPYHLIGSDKPFPKI